MSISRGDSTNIPATRAAGKKEKPDKKRQKDHIRKDSLSTTKTATEEPIRKIPTQGRLYRKPMVRFHTEYILEVNKIYIP